MPADLPKTYDPAAVEPAAYELWLTHRVFHADPAAPGTPYCIVIPPPNVTGALHLGHAINSTLQDVLIRHHRMRGFNTLWIPGIDHAGIATQAVVEKQLKEQENKTRHDVGRDALVARIWKWKQEYGDRILQQLKRIGSSCDWDRTRFTLDDMCARAVRETFFKLFKDGLIYRGKRLVNWDIFLQTSISDDEIYHETVKTSLWHLRYPIDGTDQSMVVATTRPETMLGDTAVAVHPDDPRWNWAVGKFVRLPLVDRLIPIIADGVLVNMEFGTGCVKVTPAHDPNDYACWQRQAGKIDIINMLTPDGRINEAGGPKYQGMKREPARKQIVADLAAQGLLAKEEPYETQIGHSDRSKTPIEPYLSDQWFVHMAPLAEPALAAVRDGRVKFTPERYAKTYLDWLGEKRDWPISRQLWWGHRIPIWKLENRTGAELEQSGLLIWLEHEAGANQEGSASTSMAWTYRDRTEGILVEKLYFPYKVTGSAARIRQRQSDRYDIYVCLANGDGQMLDTLQAAGFEQDPDVLDTWFSSALWPHSTLGWPEQTPELKRYYPTSVLVTSRDIITLWVARMVMTGLYNMRDVPPFHQVYIHPTILDGHGERMSKSKGNGVDPVEIVEVYGADALRFTLMQMSTETQDVRMPVKKDAQGRNTSEKFDLGRKFCNKLWNAARFTLENIREINPEPPDYTCWSLAERWIISRLGRTITDIKAALDDYRFDTYARLIYDFFWRDFCDWYVEIVKAALRDPATRGQSAAVLAATFDASLRLLHPVIPFITETIWPRLNDLRPHRTLPDRLALPTNDILATAAWPTYSAAFDKEAEDDFQRIQEIIAVIRNFRNENRIAPKAVPSVAVKPDEGEPKDKQEEMDQLVREAKSTIETLGGCTIVPEDPHAHCDAYLLAGRYHIFVYFTIDQSTEHQRLTKRLAEVTQLIATLATRLSNPTYLAKAPPHLVEQTRAQLAEVQSELLKLQSELAKLDV